MTRVVTVLVLAMSVALSGLIAASPASAVTVPVAYSLSGGDAVLGTPLGTDSTGPCVAGAGGGSFAYKVVRFKVDVSGSYNVADASGPNDARAGIYDAGGFSPATPLTNCLAFVDVTQAVALTAGTAYTLVQSTGFSGQTGAFSVTFDGPGTTTVLTTTTTTLSTNPSPSELSKATTLSASIAGGATPTGTVEFREGATLLGSAPLSGGTASLAVSSLGLGNHTLSAAYLGDSTHDVSTGVALHKVVAGEKPKVKLSVSDKTPYVGQKVKLSWIVTGADSVKATGNWKGTKSKKGSKKVKIKHLGFHVFKLKATNVNGSDRAKVKVVAQRAPKNLTVTVPDEFLTVNTQVRVRADGLDPKERFKVFLDDELLGKGFADKRGDASALVRIPKDVKEGEHTLTVMGSNDARKGSIEVLVLAPKELDVELKKDKVKPNLTQIVTVSGLLEGEAVTITVEGEELVEGVADAQGEFKYSFAVGAQPGIQTVEAVGAVPQRHGEATFEITGAGT